MSKSQSDLEEGLTEIISLNHVGYPYKKSPYIQQMRSVAYTVRKAAEGDTANAWQIANAMHYHNDGQLGLSTYQYYKGDSKFNEGSDDDIDWLFSQRLTLLEITDEVELEETFKKSEAEIYKTIRRSGPERPKVQKQTKVEPRPFTEEELKLEASILLFNPSHDALGRFAKVSGIAAIGGAVTAVGAVISAKITEAKVKNLAKQIQKEKGISESAATQQAFNRKVTAAQVGVTAMYAGMAGYSISKFKQVSKSSYSNQRNKKYQQWQSDHVKQVTWPKEANEADFKKMYRNLAKMYHPDIGGDTATMATINEFYHGKDWGGLKDLYGTSGLNLELSDEEMDRIALFIKILFEAIKDGNDFMTFPVPDDVAEVPPFIIIEDEGKRWLIMDKFTAAFIVGTVLDNWDELDGYLGEEDAGIDRPVPSEG
jgi:hypothetical protein